MARAGQLGLDLRTWGGKRKGAGAQPARGTARGLALPPPCPLVAPSRAHPPAGPAARLESAQPPRLPRHRARLRLFQGARGLSPRALLGAGESPAADRRGARRSAALT